MILNESIERKGRIDRRNVAKGTIEGMALEPVLMRWVNERMDRERKIGLGFAY